MKSILSFLVILSCVFGNAYAQDEKISLGVKGGLNIASISNSGSAKVSTGFGGASSKNKSRLLFHLGGYSEIKVNDFFSVQPELLFSMKGGGSEAKSSVLGNSYEDKSTITLSYLDIPVLARFNFGKGFNLVVGPYLGFLVAAKYKSESISTVGGTTNTVKNEGSDKDGFNTVEGGINLGVGYQMENGLNFAVRWVRGFGSIYDVSSYNRSNNVFQFSVGFDLAKF